jgi:hypothetical protein
MIDYIVGLHVAMMMETYRPKDVGRGHERR